MTTARRTRILVGVDGNPASLHALTQVADLASRLDAEVIAVLAVSRLDDLFNSSVHIQQGNWRHHLGQQLHDEWARPLADAGVEYRTRTREGSAGPVLLEAADAESVDLIVVGIHQHHRVGGRLSGWLSRHAHCPVLVVPDMTDDVAGVAGAAPDGPEAAGTVDPGDPAGTVDQVGAVDAAGGGPGTGA